jgi:hypothetical protein
MPPAPIEEKFTLFHYAGFIIIVLYWITLTLACLHAATSLVGEPDDFTPWSSMWAGVNIAFWIGASAMTPSATVNHVKSFP